MAPSPLTDRLLGSWLRCKRRAWLDRHGDPSERVWSAHRSLQLDGQRRSFSSLSPERPRHGLAACEAGAAAVVGVRLFGVGPAGLAVEAHPALVVRGAGQSRWGAFAYQPVLARQGYRLSREPRLSLTLWGRLLGEAQQAPVSHGLVLAGVGAGQQRESLALGSSLQHQLDESLQRLAGDLERSSPPPLVNDRKKCVLCSWRSLCDREAAAEGHLSEVSGIGGKRRELLQQLGLQRLGDLAAADPQQLADALAVHGEQLREVASELITQAQVQQGGQPLRRDGRPALPELAQAPGVLIYDIESDPDARDDFLHGFLRLGRDGAGGWLDPNEAPYHPLLALQEQGEARLWQRLSQLLAKWPEWPVLHYGETESLALLRLAQRQGASDLELEALRRRLIDLHQRIRRCWWLPVSSYGLKAVASWRGFRWSQKGVDGARALLWWRQWRLGFGGAHGRGSRHSLRRIFTYNRDDCLATWAAASWLLDQDQGPDQAP